MPLPARRAAATATSWPPTVTGQDRRRPAPPLDGARRHLDGHEHPEALRMLANCRDRLSAVNPQQAPRNHIEPSRVW